jgi:hypothetical protein
MSVRWLALVLLAACGAPQTCRDVYVTEDHGEQPHVLVRKCVVCRASAKLPTEACHAGINLPFGSTLESQP